MHNYHNLHATAGGIKPVTCGFTGIYASSFADAAMYAIMDEARQELVIIPLTTTWYPTAARLVNMVSFQKIHIAMPNANVRMIGDAFNLMMDYMGKKYTIDLIYPEPVITTIDRKDPTLPNMLTMCRISQNERILGLDCSIQYQALGDASAIGATTYALETVTNHGRHLFLEHVSLYKAAELLTNIIDVDKRRPYTWVSIPWRQPLFGGFSMYDIVVGGTEYITSDILDVFTQFKEQFQGRLVPYRFSCTEELQEAKSYNRYVNVPARLIV